MANEIKGLVNITTGAGVADADARYARIMDVLEKTDDYTVQTTDVGKMVVLTNAAGANKTFSMFTAVGNTTKPVHIKNSSATYKLTVAIAGQTTVLTGGTPASSSGTAANAFDGNVATSCDTTSLTSTIDYDLGTGVTKAFNRVGVYCKNEDYALKDFTIVGSNDNFSTSVVLKTCVGEVWSADEWKYYTFKNKTGYRYLRISTTATKGGGTNYPKVYEIAAFSEGIDGQASIDLYEDESLGLISDGTNFMRF